MALEIDHLVSLVPISMDYDTAIYESFDNEIIRYLPIDHPPKKIEETMVFIEDSIREINEGHALVWVILFNNLFAGCCGIHGIPSKQPHFGLWIKKDRQGKGIGKKVVPFVLLWGIKNLDIEFIKYPVDKRNIRSIKLIKGMQLERADQYEMGKQKKLDVIEYRLYK